MSLLIHGFLFLCPHSERLHLSPAVVRCAFCMFDNRASHPDPYHRTSVVVVCGLANAAQDNHGTQIISFNHVLANHRNEDEVAIFARHDPRHLSQVPGSTPLYSQHSPRPGLCLCHPPSRHSSSTASGNTRTFFK
ncbi:hypothetical protein BCR44DRAFT_61908 [Catenaria anguillulae PL171]|uniref:Uncharacterized protein n=1 Tax=Catenaria anguillulae PL171 TaxID=765915 RepID=A0A1Y2I1A8_9FUNG|nr:hypothetical protein BCR44DRAFT_61908 [Catenaria anguillulae PL171]